MNRALITLGLVLMLVSVFGCAMTPDSEWRYGGNVSKRIVWVHVPWNEIPAKCGAPSHMNQYVLACAVQIQETSTCYIFSGYPEYQAQYIYTSHMDDLWSHERKHCLGYVH